MLIVTGCGYGAPPAVDTDTDTDVAVDDTEPPDSDTAVPWTGDTDLASFTRDTFPVTDDPIGATALDGTWTGTFDLTEFVPITGGRPHCAGTVQLVIDGNAPRHVVATFAGEPWDPNLGIGRPYGLLTGIGYATLDPGDLTKFVLQAALGATNMATFDANRVRVSVTDDHLVTDYDDVTGIGVIKAGHQLTFDLVRAP
jgi:hypothetical protein